MVACLAAVLVTGSQAAGATDLEDGIRAGVARHKEATIADRRWFHEHPELGNHEIETANRIAETLEELGLLVERGVGVTGVLGLLDSGQPGPTVAIRAEMDALPVQEAEDSENPVRSKSVGRMHACGHDVHMASGLGAARVLVDLRQQLRGRVLFVFQPAEEGIPPDEKRALKEATGSDRVGANRLTHLDRILERFDVAAIFGQHGFPTHPAGTLGIMPEYALAAADSFELVIRGRSAHAGVSPWLGSDVLNIAAGVVQDLHTLPARQTDPRNPKVVSVSMLDCTDGRTNILCRTARLSGTVRTFRPEDRRDLREGIERVLDAAVKARDPKAGRCRRGGDPYALCWEIESYDAYGPPVRQDRSLLAWSAGVLAASLGEDHVIDVPPSLGAEDFAYYCEVIPCAFFSLGTSPKGGTGGLHTPSYAPDERALPVGVQTLATLAAHFLMDEDRPGAAAPQP
ncbi:MAG: M20 family metallopeptidase [Acidobacteriota bacterium]